MVRSRRSAFLMLGAALATSVALEAPAHAAAPSNDTFAGATVLTGTSATVTGSNVEATAEAGEPTETSWGDPVSATVWFRWTAPVTGYYAISTGGSDFDTTLNVYTGGSLSTLDTVALNDDGLGDATSDTGFAAAAGTTYDIQVGGTGTATTGNVQLAVTSAAVAGTMTFGSANATGDADPLEGCIGFYTDAELTRLVASGCASGNRTTTAAFSLGSLPSGIYYLAVSDDEYSTAWPGAVDPSQHPSIWIPGGHCTRTGMAVNFATGAVTLPSGFDCSTAPACVSARAALPIADAARLAADATARTDGSRESAFRATVRGLQAQIRSAKRRHRPTRRLTAQLKIAQARFAASVAAARTATRADGVAIAADWSAKSAVTVNCERPAPLTGSALPGPPPAG